jgi:hypothetical protein
MAFNPLLENPTDIGSGIYSGFPYVRFTLPVFHWSEFGGQFMNSV